MVLCEKGGHAGFFLGNGGREVEVDAKGEERVLLPAADECLPVRAVKTAGVVAVDGGEVEEGGGEAQGAGLLGRGDGVGFGARVAPVGEVGGEGGIGGEVGDVVTFGDVRTRRYGLAGWKEGDGILAYPTPRMAYTGGGIGQPRISPLI